ncbi:MAG: DKNYY domain-containing protein [Thermoanaerobaculia bacterium]|nr:DKNYY domain-containing protein [Thermoanaerobaculia bacterium]
MYHHGHALEGADPKTFVSCGECFCKDDSHVWAYGELVEGAHGASFEALTEDVGRDRHRAYVEGKAQEADGPSLEHIGGSYFADSNRPYCRVWDDLDFVEGADRATFEHLEGKYARDRTVVFLDGFVVEGAEPASFRVLNEDYGCDARAVFRSTSAIEDADPDTFEVLGVDFAKDASRVFHQGSELPEFDAATCFVVTYGNTAYVVDAKAAYFGGFEKLRKFRCDLASLEVLAEEFARDKTHVFRRGRKIKGADPATFEVLEPYYARDREQVYTYASWHRETNVVEGADPGSFLPMGSEFGTDKDRLYFLGDLDEQSKTNGDSRVVAFVEEHSDLVGYWWTSTTRLDPASFEVVSDGFARDSASVYLHGVRLPAVQPSGFRNLGGGFGLNRQGAFWFEVSRRGDVLWFDEDGDSDQLFREGPGGVVDGGPLTAVDPSRLVVHGGGYASDGQSCFFYNQRIDGADAATFRVLGHDVACDGRRVYQYGRPLRGVSSKDYSVLGERYARSTTAVFWDGAVIKSADPASFEVLDHASGYYARDRKHLYNANGRRVVKTIDGSSFRFLDERWGTDGTVVFDADAEKVLKGADGASFRVLASWLVADGETVFVEGRREKRLDPASLELLGAGYVGDARGVYWYSPAGFALRAGGSEGPQLVDGYLHRLDGAMTASFEALSELIGRARERFFIGPMECPAEEATSRLEVCSSGESEAAPGEDLGHDYRRLDGNILFRGHLVPDTDPAHFVVLGDGYARDRERIYFDGRKIE